jgi:quercetin dioxygenase-like cupin family protein
MDAYALAPGGSVTDDPGVKAGRESTGGAFTLIESRTRGGAPLHRHEREDEAMYVLEGSIWARCGESRFEAGAGSFVFLPRGVPHEWDVIDEEAVVLIITAPAGLEAFLHDFHNAAGDRNDIARRHGIDLL